MMAPAEEAITLDVESGGDGEVEKQDAELEEEAKEEGNEDTASIGQDEENVPDGNVTPAAAADTGNDSSPDEQPALQEQDISQSSVKEPATEPKWWNKSWWTSGRIMTAVFLFVVTAGLFTCIGVLFGAVSNLDSGSTAVYPNETFTVYTPPLNQEEVTAAQEAFNTRKALIVGYEIVNGSIFGHEVLWAYANQSIPEENIVNVVDELETSETADFDIMNLLRIQNYTDQFDDLIIPVLEKVVAWPEEGNSKTQYVYWSENHMIMWLCALQLTHERYGWQVQPEHRTRLTLYLQQKIQNGFLEFFSGVYIPYTFAALANLYDFSNDAEIKELAEGAALRLLRDLDLMTNDKGAQFVVSGRNYKDVIQELSHQTLTMGWILTGRGGELSPGEWGFGQGPLALATTTLNVTSILANPAIHADLIREAGYNLESFKKEWAALSPEDQQLVAMSMGGYAHPDYIASMFSTLSHYDLWDASYFKDMKALRGIPPGILNFCANVGQVFSVGSLLHAHIVLHKYNSSMLSTLNDYHKGISGAQQWAFVATAGSAPVFAATGDYRRNNPTVHFPYAKQTKNVALIVFSPSSDLQMLNRGNLEVTMYWPEESFSESSRQVGNWIAGREDSGYVALYRPCLDVNEEGFPSCDGIQQVWVCVVGHEDTHGSFDDFLETLQEATVASSGRKGYTSAYVEADNQTISIEWQQVRVGPAKLTLLLVLLFVIFLLALSIFACCQIKPRKTSPDDERHDGADESKGRCKRCSGCKRCPGCLKSRAGIILLVTILVLVAVMVVLIVAIVSVANESQEYPIIVTPEEELY